MLRRKTIKALRTKMLKSDMVSLRYIVSSLLDHGADLYAQDAKDLTAFHLPSYKYNQCAPAQR